jgi:outer membrane protein assembly factor BamB
MTPMNVNRRLGLMRLFLTALAFLACGELFAADKKPLINTLWKQTGETKIQPLTAWLNSVVVDEIVYTVSQSGHLQALSLATGEHEWHRFLEERISSGVAHHRDKLFVTTDNAVLHAFNRSNGQLHWSVTLHSESTANIVTDDASIYIRTLDGKLTAYDTDGGVNWVYSSVLPPLTVRGSSAVLVTDAAIISGFANGQLMAFDKETGYILWTVTLGHSLGLTDIERLSDIDGTPVMKDGIIYASSVSGKTAAISRQGQILWWADVASNMSCVVTEHTLYWILTGGEVVALDRDFGHILWRKQVSSRDLSALIWKKPYLVVVDTQGSLYGLSGTSGEVLARHNVFSRPVYRSLPRQGMRENWKPLRERYGANSTLMTTSLGILVTTGAGDLVHLSVAPPS